MFLKKHRPQARNQTQSSPKTTNHVMHAQRIE